MGKRNYFKLWITGNSLVILGSILYIWLVRSHDSSIIVTSQLIAQIGILLFFVNVNMYFIFLVIRNTKQRNIKITLAKFSRKMMKWHIKIAISGTILICVHALINITQIGPLLGFVHLKMVSGYLAFSMLTFTLIAGYLRHKKASGFRRKFHLGTAMAFAVVFLFHIFVFFK